MLLSPSDRLDTLHALEPASRWEGKELTLPCPAHGGDNNKLYLALGQNGRIVATCFSGDCTWDEIVAAVLSRYEVELRSSAPPLGASGPDERRWVYRRDSDGTSVTQVELRFPGPCGRKWRGKPCAEEGQHKHCWREPKGQLGAGFALMAHGEGGLPVVCEGEKTSAAVGRLDGYTGYSYLGGVPGADKADYSMLSGAELVLVAPDRDRPGSKAALRSADALLAQEVVAVRILDSDLLPDVGGADLADVDDDRRRELLDQLVADGSDYKPSASRGDGGPPVSPVNGSGDLLDTTYVGDAWRLLERYGKALLLASPSEPEERHEAYVLDESTGIWRGGPESLEAIHADTAKAFVRKARTAYAAREIDSGVFKERLQWGRRTQGSAGAAEAARMLPVALGEMRAAGLDSGVTVHFSADLNPPGRYLGCANGVLDLDTGSMVPPAEARAYLVTRSTAMPHRPGAQHPLVDSLATHIEPELRDFLLDSFAYALRGVPSRRVIIMAGPPNGGKSTVREAAASAVGDSFAFALPQAALLRDRYLTRNQHNAGMTELLTHRFALASELPEGDVPVDAGQLKQISGGDTIRLRELRERHKMNRPATATVFLSLNTEAAGCSDLQRLPLRDSALRDRVQLVEMPLIPGQRDSRTIEQMRTEPVAIAMLAELVRRAIRLQEPPVPPNAVRLAVSRLYEQQVGELGVFALTCIEVTHVESDFVSSADIHDAATRWVEERGGVLELHQRELLEAVKRFRDLPQRRKKKVRGKAEWVYPGVRISLPGSDDI